MNDDESSRKRSRDGNNAGGGLSYDELMKENELLKEQLQHESALFDYCNDDIKRLEREKRVLEARLGDGTIKEENFWRDKNMTTENFNLAVIMMQKEDYDIAAVRAAVAVIRRMEVLHDDLIETENNEFEDERGKLATAHEELEKARSFSKKIIVEWGNDENMGKVAREKIQEKEDCVAGIWGTFVARQKVLEEERENTFKAYKDEFDLDDESPEASNEIERRWNDHLGKCRFHLNQNGEFEC